MDCVSEYVVLLLMFAFFCGILAYLISTINKREALLKQLTPEKNPASILSAIAPPRTSSGKKKSHRSKSLEPAMSWQPTLMQEHAFPGQHLEHSYKTQVAIDIPSPGSSRSKKKEKKEKKHKKTRELQDVSEEEEQ